MISIVKYIYLLKLYELEGIIFNLDPFLIFVYNLPHMYKKPLNFRQRVIDYYLSGGHTLHQTAARFGIHYQTVFKWVNQYKKDGAIGVYDNFKPVWNRATSELENKIVAIKERWPMVTIKIIREILVREGFGPSSKCIASVLRRYGYAGFKKSRLSSEFIDHLPWSQEARTKYQTALVFFKQGRVDESVAIINSIPSLPRNDLLAELPEQDLNIRRRIEKASLTFGKLPLPEYLRYVKRLYRECIERGLNYSACRIGIIETMVLAWSGRIRQQLKKIKELKKLIQLLPATFEPPRRRTGLIFELYFPLLIGEGMACAHLLRVRRGFKILNECQRLLTAQKVLSPYLMIDLGTLCSNLEDYARAEYWFRKAYNKVDRKRRQRLKTYLAYHIGFARCDLRRGRRLLRASQALDWVRNLWRLRFQSLFALIEGNPLKAISFSMEALALSKKEELHRDLFNTYFTIASAQSSLGNQQSARQLLSRIIPLLIKNQLVRQLTISRMLLERDFTPSRDILLLPTIRVIHRLREGRFLEAFRLAQRKGNLSYFYRCLFFYPEAVLNQINRGRLHHLPRAILRLPVFNEKVSTYNIRCLGPVEIFKNQQPLKVKLTPRESGLLIHLALVAPEPHQKMCLEDLYKNFWSESKNPSRNFSHLLVRVKKLMQIPKHLLEVRFINGARFLVNRGIYFTVDLNEFEQNLTRARALVEMGEWSSAIEEYRRAFRYLRGEPLKRNFDAWSLSLREKIIMRTETELQDFVRHCRMNGDIENLIKVTRIIQKQGKWLDVKDTGIEEALSQIKI